MFLQFQDFLETEDLNFSLFSSYYRGRLYPVEIDENGSTFGAFLSQFSGLLVLGLKVKESKSNAYL